MKNKETVNQGEKHVRYYKMSELTSDEMMEDYFAEEEEMKNGGKEENVPYPVDEDGAPDFTKVTVEDMESGKCDEMIAEYIRRARAGEFSVMGECDPDDEEAWEEIKEKMAILQEAWEKAEEEAEEE